AMRRVYSVYVHCLSWADPPREPVLTSLLETSDGRLGILQCTVDSNPPAELALLKGDALVASTAQPQPAAPPRLSASSSLNSLRVKIHAVVMEDEGEYVCLASNAYGNASTAGNFTAGTVRVVARPAAEVPEGAGVTLTCEAPAAPPGTVYAWYKNTRWLAEGPAATLALAAAAPADAGAYSCQAGTGPGARRALPTALRVLYGPRDLSLTAFLESPGGRRAILHCTVDSHPPAAITLRRGADPAALASTQGPSDPRLRVRAAPNSLRVELSAVAPGDAGPYVCSASNAYGSASTAARLEAEPLRIAVEPSPEVPEGAAATLTCAAAPWVGEEANFTWYKNGRWLQEGPAASLVFARVSSADAGSYRCHASGTRGSAASAPASLSVTCEPPGAASRRQPRVPRADPPRSVSVHTFLETRSGRAGVVVCTADSHPPAALALYRRGRLLASSRAPAAAGQRLRAVASHNALRLEMGALGPEDAAEYTCVAANAAGNATASSYFNTRTLSHLLAFTVLAGLLIALICAAAVAFAAVRLWPR
ncbi:SN protein, partial [Casuarius casuarius]|nr:SN protein [Casuarius casuarius]